MIKKCFTFFFFITFFAIIFSPQILQYQIPENNSLYFGLAQFNHLYTIFINQFSSNSFITSYLYPSNEFIWSDTFLIHFPIYLFSRLLGFGEFYSLWIYLIVLQSLNGSLFILYSKRYIKNKWSLIFGALLFCSSNFTLGHIGDPPAAFYGLFFLTFYFLDIYKDNRNIKYILYASLICSLQTFSMAYVNLFLQISLFIYFIFYLRVFRHYIFVFYIPVIFMNFIFFRPYFEKMEDKNFIKVFNNKASATLHSYNYFSDFFKKLPGNIYFRDGNIKTNSEYLKLSNDLRQNNLEDYISPFVTEEASYNQNVINTQNIYESKTLYHQIRKSGFFGYSPLLLSIIGILFSPKLFLMILLIGLTLSVGPFFYIGAKPYIMPLFFFYEYLDIFDFFRVPSRAYFLVLFAISILSSIGLDKVIQKIKKETIAVFFIIILLIENIPQPMISYKFVDVPNELTSFFENIKNKNILFLPSDLGLFYVSDTNNIFPYSREYIYMNWKTYLNNNTPNGNGAYLPLKRIELQKLLTRVNLGIDLIKLKTKFKVDYIVYAKQLRLKSEKDMTPYFNSSKILESTFRGKEINVYKFR